MRRHKLHRGALAGVLLALLVGVWTAVAFAAPPQAPAPPRTVGTNPDVQAWFKIHEAQRITLNDALQAAYEQLGQGPAPGPGDGCARLLPATDAMLATLPTPKQTLNPLVVAGVGKFKAGAQQCLAGNATAARRSLADGARERADADLQIDEVLETPDAQVP
jgi:hypothetical protein